MSGIVGIVNLDGAPIVQDLLWRMTHLMSFRGPDAQEIWIDGNVSFGHTLLRTTWEADTENQPLTLDGEIWLTADARIDGRAELINALKDKLAGRLHTRSLNDAELILYAYEAWGEDCVKHLIGDFAFAIWDGRKRCLFCARDHFGIKPFYYAHVGNVFVFGNTLESILIHPDISPTLNDQAIGDLLLFDFNRDPASTSFKDIVRIPPAHTLTLEPAVGKLTTRRFWNIPTEVDTRRHPQSYYLECFEELFDAAVEDRLRTDKVELLMSGGLDSTAIASAAVRIGQERNRELGVRAQCVIYNELMEDDEGKFAAIAAEALKIPIYFLEADKFRLYEDAGTPELAKPEPVHEPLQKLSRAQYRTAESYSRVALCGLGPDVMMSFWLQSHIDALTRNMKYAQLTRDLFWYFWNKGRPPRLHLGERLRKRLQPQIAPTYYPRWLNRAFEERLELPVRRERILQFVEGSHPQRETSYRLLADACAWTSIFEYENAGVTRTGLEMRYPYFDVRLIQFLLTLPPIPWCVDKKLLRESLRGKLPPEIHARPKTPLAADPFLSRINRGDDPWSRFSSPHVDLQNYVDVELFRACSRQGNPDAWVNMRPVSLNLWLQEKETQPYNPSLGGSPTPKQPGHADRFSAEGQTAPSQKPSVIGDKNDS